MLSDVSLQVEFYGFLDVRQGIFNSISFTNTTRKRRHIDGVSTILTSARRRKSFVGSRSPGIARSRPYATKIDCEAARNGAPDGDLTIPLKQMTTEGFPPSCTRFKYYLKHHLPCSLY